MATEREQLDAARKVIAELQEVLERFSKAPHAYATVLRIKDGRVDIASNGNVSNIELPATPKIKPTDCVLLEAASGQIIKVWEHLPIGDPCVITLSRTDGTVDVQIAGSTRTVLAGQIKDLKEGDEVRLDSSKMIVLSRVAKASKERFAVSKGTGVCWDDIGGQFEAKRAMREAIELPLTNPKIFAAYGKRECKGILLSGSPGCGKTMLGKAAATALSELTGGESAFMYIKGPEVLDPYVGVAEQTIRTIFQRAREHKEKHGAPAVVFIDEADAILGRRGSLYAHMEKTIVPMFLTEMDGLEASGALVILATNRPDTLDPAVVRDGRMDRKVRVERPSQEDSELIFSLYLKKVPLSREFTPLGLAGLASAELFSARHIINTVFRSGHETQDVKLPLHGLVSGALIEGVVTKAGSFALHRDIEAKAKNPSGVTQADIIAAIELTVRENRDVDHGDAILGMLEKQRGGYAEAAE